MRFVSKLGFPASVLLTVGAVIASPAVATTAPVASHSVAATASSVAAPATTATVSNPIVALNASTDDYCAGYWQAASWGRGCLIDGLAASDDTASNSHYVYLARWNGKKWKKIPGTSSNGPSSKLKVVDDYTLRLKQSGTGRYKTIHDTATG